MIDLYTVLYFWETIYVHSYISSLSKDREKTERMSLDESGNSDNRQIRMICSTERMKGNLCKLFCTPFKSQNKTQAQQQSERPSKIHYFNNNFHAIINGFIEYINEKAKGSGQDLRGEMMTDRTHAPIIFHFDDYLFANTKKEISEATIKKKTAIKRID